MNLMATPVPYHPQENGTHDRKPHSSDSPYVIQSSGDRDPNITLSQSESPLASLVRRASSRRYQRAAREQKRSQADSTSPGTGPQAQYTTPIVEDDEYVSPYDDYYDTHGNQRRSSESNNPSARSQPYPIASYITSQPHANSANHDDAYDAYDAYDYNATPTTANSQYSQYTSASTAQPQYLEQQMGNMSLRIPSRESGLGNTPPHSPLLHSQFARDSVATTSSSDPSYWAPDSTRVSTDSRYLQAIYQEHSQHSLTNRGSPGRLFNDNTSSVYSDTTSTGPALRDSWRSTDTAGPMRNNNPDRHLSHNNTSAAAQREVYDASLSSPLPTVVVSSDGEYASQDSYASSSLRSIPLLVKPTVASTPIHESANPMHAEAMGESVTPQLPPDMQEQKKAVLERNATRNTPTPTGTRSATAMGSSSAPGYVQSPLFKYDTQQPSGLSQQAHSYAVSDHGRSYAESGHANSTITQDVRSNPPTLRGPAKTMMRGPSLAPSSAQTNQSLHPHSQSSSQVGLSSGRSSPVSVYSNYSYYQFENSLPSPTDNRHPSTPQVQAPLSRSTSRQGSRTPSSDQRIPQGPLTPQDYLQLGIQHHEANRLQESARCFERSANEGGGCGVGMLMYGLTLRHGWGCAKNEKVGFKWLRKAAECAVGDLEKVRTGGRDVDVGAVQSELVLAIYEVGQCFFHGWGVPKDQKMAVSYYAVAARLGDGDAQGDLAFCLANGKGCKKNKKEAAQWYRSAIQQGQSDVGLAWIYKDKYM